MTIDHEAARRQAEINRELEAAINGDPDAPKPQGVIRARSVFKAYYHDRDTGAPRNTLIEGPVDDHCSGDGGFIMHGVDPDVLELVFGDNRDA